MGKKEKKTNVALPPVPSSFDKLLSEINKVYGNNTVKTGAEIKAGGRLPRISTGNPQLDVDLGGGMMPGRVHLIYGKESSGKTFIVNKCLATHTKRRERVAFFDVERTFDEEWAEKCGIDLDYLHVFTAPYCEKYLDLAHVVIVSGEFSAVCIDSLAALLPLKMMNDSIEQAQMGLEGKAQAEFFRKILSGQHEACSQDKDVATIYLINQTREKIGIVYGNPETLPGGKSQHFYSSVKIKVTKKGIINYKQVMPGGQTRELPVGQDIEYYIEKNKTAQPGKKGEISMYTSDFDRFLAGSWDPVGAIISLALNLGILEQGGAWYRGPRDIKEQGYIALWEKLKNNADLCEEIYKRINDYYKKNGIDLAFDVTEIF